MTKQNIIIKSEEKRIVFAEVYAPLHIDTDGEAMTPNDIEQMAHTFISSGYQNKIDVNHNLKESGCYAVESFIARKNDPDNFIEGAWVLGVKIVDDDLWEAVKSGELNGFSFYGPGNRVNAQVETEQITSAKGLTEESTSDIFPPHKHEVDLDFKDGKMTPSETSEAIDHTHKITKLTATEQSMGHSHRLIIAGD